MSYSFQPAGYYYSAVKKTLVANREFVYDDVTCIFGHIMKIHSQSPFSIVDYYSREFSASLILILDFQCPSDISFSTLIRTCIILLLDL